MTTPQAMLEASKASGEFSETFGQWFGVEYGEAVFINLAEIHIKQKEQNLINAAQATLNRRFPYGIYQQTHA